MNLIYYVGLNQKFYIFFFIRINGSIPSNAEIRDNVLIFKGPLTYDVQGTYVCDATNSIGTRSASVEISIIGRIFSCFLFIIKWHTASDSADA